MVELPTEILVKIFGCFTVQELLSVAIVCHRFHLIVHNFEEVWFNLETTAEFTPYSFDKIVVSHAHHFKVLAIQYSQKDVRYSSPDNYIETCLSLCVNIRCLDLSYNTSVVTINFVKSMPYLKSLKLVGCTSINPGDLITNLKLCKSLEVIDISRCIQFEDNHAVELANVCEMLSRLNTFKAEWTCRFTADVIRRILQMNDIYEFAATPVH